MHLDIAVKYILCKINGTSRRFHPHAHTHTNTHNYLILKFIILTHTLYFVVFFCNAADIFKINLDLKTDKLCVCLLFAANANKTTSKINCLLECASWSETYKGKWVDIQWHALASHLKWKKETKVWLTKRVIKRLDTLLI